MKFHSHAHSPLNIKTGQNGEYESDRRRQAALKEAVEEAGLSLTLKTLDNMTYPRIREDQQFLTALDYYGSDSIVFDAQH
ncbi:unnamed protein product [Caenorhabditis nigoni]